MNKSILIFLALLLLSCQSDLNHSIKPTSSKGDQFAIEIYGDYTSPFYEIEFKCLNSSNYSKDSFELVSYQLINLETYQNLNLSKDNEGFKLLRQDRQIHKLSFPKDSKSKVTSISNKRGKCISEHNQLVRIEYKLDSDLRLNQKHVKLIGYSNSIVTKQSNYDWDYFLQSKENLYQIFKEPYDCYEQWDIKF